MSDPTRLRKLAEITRGLLEDIDSSRQDLLSPVELNRALRQILRNQVAIMQRLSGDGVVEAPGTQTRQTTRPDNVRNNGGGPLITLRKRDAVDPYEDEDEDEEDPDLKPTRAYEPTPQQDELDDPTQRDLSRVEPLEHGELRELQAALDGGAVRTAGDTRSRAEVILGESRTVSKMTARVLVEAFDNRDKNYDKGLVKLNRWVDGGSAGTPFQWRDDKAYLNLNGLSADAIRRYEKQLMARMGFSRRLGRLLVPDLQGEVVVYERP